MLNTENHILNRQEQPALVASFFVIESVIRFIDMFSGIGGFREGLTRAGDFACVGHCEIDKYANRSYNALFDTKGEWFVEDARKADPETMPEFQLLCGGFPCQTFSIAGSRKGFGDPRGTLFFELARLAEARKPPYLLFENVPGLLSHDGGRTFATILNTLDRLGYDVEYYIRWQDVLAVFSSYVAGSEQGAPVAALTEEQVDKLREIMWAMNAVDYATRAETAVIETTDKNGKSTTTEITETVLVIELTHKTPDEMAADYHFTIRQNTYLQLLQDPQYEELWAELLGGFEQGRGEVMSPDGTRTPTGNLQWPLPVAGTITSQFGHRVDPITGEVSSHTGTDIACAEGTPILAAADGTITAANGLDSWGGSYGYYIQIDHGGGLETLYAHCSSICVTTGQQVQAGEVIGYVGHTGRVTGNHLHLEVRIDGNRADVLRYFTL